VNQFTLIAGLSPALLLGVAVFSEAQPPNQPNPDTAALAQGGNQFACDLYHKLSAQDGNLFFSPYSISSALAMTYGGARGQTAIDMAKTLHFPFEGQRVHTAFADLIQQINQPGQKRPYQLSVANRLWGQKGYNFLPEFLKLTKDAYGAGLEKVDFEYATEQARQTINDWVAKETQEKIKDLIPQGALTRETRLVLTNAIYFKSRWVWEFGPKATIKEDFTIGARKTAKVDMMRQNRALNLLENDSFQMLELPYELGQLSMLVVLPRLLDSFPKIERQFSAESITQWLSLAKRHQVDVSLPKFTFSSKFRLRKNLSELGMAIAFDGNSANFDGLKKVDKEKFCLSDVIHEAFIGVDESTTEAAAATAVIGVRAISANLPLPPATFRADHPFLFLIRDNRTGSILFMGRVVNP
jgi:serpin B